MEAQITKIDDEKRLVFGWASIIKDADGKILLDRQDDYIDSEDELEKAAYDYVLRSRDGGEMHIRKGVSTMVESVVFSKEKQEAMGIPAGTMPVGWWIGFRVNDDRVWEEVKKGGYTGFSVHGTGQRNQQLLKDGEYTEIEKRTFTVEERRKMAEEGKALPDGSYPIANQSDLQNALQSIGRAKNRAQVLRHIRSRAKALGLEDMLPDWAMAKSDVSKCSCQESAPTTIPVSKKLLETLTKAQKQTKKQKKVATVMREFKAGKLKSSSGEKVTNPKQAIAIAISESNAKKMKKGDFPGHPFRGNQWTKGRGGAGAKGSGASAKGKEGVVRARSVDEALKLVAQGKTVEIASPRRAATLIDELNRRVKAAAAKGEKAENIDLCKVSVPGTNLFCGESKGIPRIEMPQFSGTPVPGSKADKLPKNSKGEVDGAKAFEDHLTSMGVKVEQKTVKASELKASQNELVGAKVAGMVNNKDFDPAGEAIFVSRDGYVIDGHHRWAAQVGRDLRDGSLGDLPLNVRVVDMPITQILKEANSWATDFGIAAKSGKG